MHKRIWVNLALGLLVLALALAIHFGVGRPATHPKSPLLAIRPDAVTRLAFAQAGHPPVTFRKIGSQWWLIHPVRARAENLELESLIDDVSEPIVHRYPITRFKLKAIGLAPPHLRVWINGEKLAFGINDPVGHLRFIQRGQEILLVEDVLAYRLAGSFYPLLSPRLLPPGSHIAELRIPGLTLTRTAAGTWHLVPQQKNVTSGMIARLMRRWTYASALSVGPRGSGQPFGTVEIRLIGHKQIRRYRLVRDSLGFALAPLNRSLRFVFPQPVESKMLSLVANRRMRHARATRG